MKSNDAHGRVVLPMILNGDATRRAIAWAQVLSEIARGHEPTKGANNAVEPIMSDVDSQWSFSLGFYAQQGVRDACLTLQDSAGVDINILLVTLYLTLSCGVRPTLIEIDAMERVICPFRGEVIAPLRKLRRDLKLRPYAQHYDKLAEIRSRLQDAELLAERQQHLVLAEHRVEHPVHGSGDLDFRQAIRDVSDFYLARSGAPDDRRSEVENAIKTLENAASLLATSKTLPGSEEG